MKRIAAIVGVLLGLTAGSAQASFIINLSFSGFTPTEESYFTAAKTFWEGKITGYQGSSTLSGLSILVTSADLGDGGIAAEAGPTDGVDAGGFLYATEGVINVNKREIDDLIKYGAFTSVIQHEMAHVIGFGSLWADNGVYIDGTGKFTGAYALSAYKDEFNQPSATFVPVELCGSDGTADGHWAEVCGGFGLTGIVDRQGRDLAYEMMTGWYEGSDFVSRTTIASFQDIGYTVAQDVPAPATITLLGLGLVGIGACRRKGGERGQALAGWSGYRSLSHASMPSMPISPAT
jgi:hypothetical protein